MTIKNVVIIVAVVFALIAAFGLTYKRFTFGWLSLALFEIFVAMPD